MHSTFKLKDGYFGSGKYLWNSLKKYGKENHIKEILEFLPDRISLINREKELVNEELIKDKLCMNLMVGGKGGYNENGFGGIEGRIKGISKTNIRFYTDKNYREKKLKQLKENLIKIKKYNKFNIRFKNKQHSEETKQKMRKSAKGKHNGKLNSQYGTCWIYNLQLKENKKIKKEDLKYWLNLEWILGRKMNF